MRAPKPFFRSKPAQVRQPFGRPPFEVPHALVRRSTIGLVFLTLLLAGIGWRTQEGLTGRQIAGAQRVLHSLHAETTVLDEQWRKGALPAKALKAEQEHIEEETEQQNAQLAGLRMSHG
jgi:hypothetical protein